MRASGLEIAYERVGTGPPLVLVHGVAGDGRIWQAQLAALADEFTVVAWDEPGAGRSSDVPAGFELADYARCLARLIEALALGPAHVGGISWVGARCSELYRQRPELVRTLVMVDTYAGWKGSLPETEARTRVSGAREMLGGARRGIRSHASGAVRRGSSGTLRRACSRKSRRRSVPRR